MCEDSVRHVVLGMSRYQQRDDRARMATELSSRLCFNVLRLSGLD